MEGNSGDTHSHCLRDDTVVLELGSNIGAP
ncbi:hypothetical protein BV95_02673 [Sphingobium chlorophenolicum]|uniref:Uncharacterized protein n=1 Tax=Sphingobium chlorophenolicum TaxID=46429 RepID=A0A081RCU5_SPHCR|nr:hypothetical protein BV95_02673 [Sphingobium chlorophenolicum]